MQVLLLKDVQDMHRCSKVLYCKSGTALKQEKE
jgi:hypothetical protein